MWYDVTKLQSAAGLHLPFLTTLPMLQRSNESRIRALLFMLAGVSCVVLLVWMGLIYATGWHRELQSVEDWRVRIGLGLLGVAVASALGRWLIYCGRVFPRASAMGLAALAISTVCYFLLAWTSLKVHPTLWRIWWISLIAVIAAAHAMALRLPATGRRGRIETVAVTALAMLALMVAVLAFQENILNTPHPLYLTAMGVLFVVVAAGSALARLRFTRARAPRHMPRWQRLAWVSAGVGGVFFTGLYVGRLTAPAPLPWYAGSSLLAGMTPDQIDQQVRLDLRRLQVLHGALDDLRSHAATLHAEFAVNRNRDGRDFYTPAEAERLRPHYASFLACRDALLRIVGTYRSFRELPDPDLQARCFIAAYGAGSACYAASLELLHYGDDPAVRRRLNEAEPAWDLPPGRFDHIRRGVASDETAQTFAEMTAYYRQQRQGWADRQVLPATQLTTLVRQIDADIARISKADVNRSRVGFELLVSRVRADSLDPLYRMQSTLSTWIGDTRLVARPSFISVETIKGIQPRLQPGDVLLERRNWFASNAFLPGFWPHAAMYIGTPGQLAELGILRRSGTTWTSDDATVANKLQAYLGVAHDGEPHTVIEAVSEGVIFNSLTESMSADYVAVLRPRNLTRLQVAAAIRRGFAHSGKPYDFEFDFASADKLVCTELVYQCYQGMLSFDCDPARPGEQLPEIMGRRALPAMEFCRKFAREREQENRDFDFVLFLDAVPTLGASREAGVDEFIASGERPKGFNE